jgi:predicted nucleotide-binding protein
MASREKRSELPRLVMPREELAQLLKQQIVAGQTFIESTKMRLVSDADIDARDRWSNRNKEILQRAFDHEHYRSEYNMAVATGVVHLSRGGPSRGESQGDFATAVSARINYLQGLLERLDVIPVAVEAATAAARKAGRPVASRNVFIVHGRDEAAKQTVARFLSTLDLEPIILHEQASRGQTIVEKFEANSEVAFAIVLVTPDDEGRLRGDSDLRPRARQNVVWEWGYFVGKFGRGNVCALYSPGTELPSDLQGVAWVELDTGGAWRLELARELLAAGINVDLNRLVPRR